MPTIPQALDQAMSYHREGRLGEAESLYRQILAVNPQHADALRLLGLLAHQVGSHATAVDLIGQAIAQSPQIADYHNDLGNACHALGRLDEAVAAFRRALQLRPDLVAAHNNLGNALRDQGRLEDAIASYLRGLERQPDSAEMHNNLGNARQAAGQIEEALAAFRRALDLKPDYAMARNNLGNALLAHGQLDAAIAAYREALALAPNFPLALHNLGSALLTTGRLDEAVTAFRQALALQPDLAMAHNNLGNALREQGRLDEALTCYEQALQAQPDAAEIHSNLLAALHDRPQSTLADIFAAHCAYDRRHAAPLHPPTLQFPNTRDPDRPLRIGFVSAHFALHPVGHFLIGLLSHLGAHPVEIFCYSDALQEDAMTHRLQATAAHWRVIHGWTDARVAEEIRRDVVDILFDLAGHTSGNRLLVFARRPAPLQMTWLDYVGTTGLAAMDYILADHLQIPPAAEPYYREKVLRLPGDYLCFEPPADAPPVNPLPALTRGTITFGSFNTLSKITPSMIAVWARLLQQVPGARLLLQSRGLTGPETAIRLHELFAAQGIAAARVELRGRASRLETLAAYHQVDIALDTFPYNGGLTTCEALWMGVPVVTCHGETFASRHGLTHLTAAGLPDTITGNLEDYGKVAVALANDLPQLAASRSGLRARLAASPLCDGRKFAGDFAALLRKVWHAWCAS